MTSVPDPSTRPVAPSQAPPVSGAGLLGRLRLTALEVGRALLAVPALVLVILLVVGWPLVIVAVGLVLVLLAVPLSQQLTQLHRALCFQTLGTPIESDYAPSDHAGLLGRVRIWAGDQARWRDLAFLAYAVTGGFALSLVVPGLLFAAVVHPVLALTIGGWWWPFTATAGALLWWFATPAISRARSLADRAILARSLTADLERRVEQVTASRTDTIDHWATELRRIERDLHDGAQARMVSVGMSLGLAEDLVRRDPDAAVELLRDARGTATAALDDLRSVVHSIHPPVLADRGLGGAVEALAAQLALPMTTEIDLDGPPIAEPLQAAVYFAVAECATNAAKHGGASRGWVTLRRTPDLLHIEVGDDGHGGADLDGGTGLAGVRRRLAAFEGTMTVDSPAGGPTTISWEVPCAPSSPKTSPSSATG